MTKKFSTYLLIVAAILLISISGFIFAQEPPSGAQGPSAEEISQFEKEFGAPPEAFAPTEIEKPKFEQPGNVPDEVKQYVTDKDLVDVYCAMVHWQSGSFFIALDAMKKYVVPAVDKVKELGIDVSLPDLESIKAEGLKRIENICNAKTLDEAEKLVQEFSDWGQKEAAGKFDNLKSDLESKIKVKGDELREKVKSQIDPFVVQERAKIESELRQEADQLVVQKQAELESSQTPPDVEAVQNEIKQQIVAKVEAKKQEMKNKIQTKVNEIMGGQKEKFEEIGKLFQGIGTKINGEIQSRQGEYDQYKQEAFQLRKNLVFKILDKNIEEGLKHLDAAEADIDAAKKEDSSIKSVGEIKSDIQEDRRALGVKLDAALEAGDEVAFQQVLNDFKVKWEGLRQEMEKAASQSVSKACTVALAQFDNAKSRIDPGLTKIKDLQSKCSVSTSEECLKVNEFSPRFGTLTTKLTDLKTQMTMAEKICQTPETADRKNLVALFKKIQADGEDVKVYGEALEAEKKKIIAESTQAVCAQILPQLSAAKTELANNDVVVLRNKINQCRGKVTEECNVVNQLVSKFNKFDSEVNKLLSDSAKIEIFCATSSPEKFEELRDLAGPLRAKAEELRALGKDLRVEQTEKASEKAFCRAVAPKLEIAKGEISAGVNELVSLQSSCSGKTDARCATINSLADKFTAVKGQADNIFKKISGINTVCEKASDNPPSDSLVSQVESLKADEKDIKKAAADLKTEKEKFYEMGREIIIPKNSAWEGVLPAGKTLELFGRIDYQRAAGGQWLMEISVNGQPISTPLLNKGKTFKYTDGRIFPYYSPGGGGSAQTSFKDGKPYAYRFTPNPAWMLFYVPDYETNNSSAGGGYQMLTDPGQAHRYVWDISSLAVDGNTMTIKIRNSGVLDNQTLSIIVKLNVK